MFFLPGLLHLHQCQGHQLGILTLTDVSTQNSEHLLVVRQWTGTTSLHSLQLTIFRSFLFPVRLLNQSQKPAFSSSSDTPLAAWHILAPHSPRSFSTYVIELLASTSRYIILWPRQHILPCSIHVLLPTPLFIALLGLLIFPLRSIYMSGCSVVLQISKEKWSCLLRSTYLDLPLLSPGVCWYWLLDSLSTRKWICFFPPELPVWNRARGQCRVS